MDHLTEGQVQAYLDGEVEGAAAQRLAAHLEACAACVREFAMVRNTAERASRALTWIDRPASTAAAYAEVVGAHEDVAARRIEAHRSWGRPARVGFLKAAMLALFASGAAAAAIPGSPVQRWLDAAWQRLTGAESETPAVQALPEAPDVVAPPVETQPAEVASISIEPIDGTMRVTLAGGRQTRIVRVQLVDAAHATVETDASANTRFSTGPSSIQATGLGAGEVTVRLPRSLAHAVVELDGRTLLEKDGEVLSTSGIVLERTDDLIVFRTS